MAINDILLPASVEGRSGVKSNLFVAFVPITVALIGIGAVLLGGISARGPAPVVAAAGIDPVTTGSIAAPEADRRALEMLDK